MHFALLLGFGATAVNPYLALATVTSLAAPQDCPLDVVKASGAENAYMILDTWHWVRANQPIDLEVIKDIPADKIVSIQINDVWDRPYAKSILRDESMHDRLAPGTGIGCTADFVKMVREKGIEPKAIGVEVISDAILAKGVAEAAKHTFDNTKKVLEQVWPEVL